VRLGQLVCPSTHARFFPLVSDEDLMRMQGVIAQEFGIYDEQMLSSRTFYLASLAKQIWENKKTSIESGMVYIGG